MAVDGLDEEDPSEPVAQRLPYGPDSAAVVVSSRPNPSVRGHAPDDHPLDVPDNAARYRLGVSEYASARLDQAVATVNTYWASRGDRGKYVAGLLTAAPGYLSAAELGELVEARPGDVVEDLGVIEREMEILHDHDGVDRYRFGHVHLEHLVRAKLDRTEPQRLERRILNWAEQYRDQGWPPDTPLWLARHYDDLTARHYKAEQRAATITPERSGYLAHTLGHHRPMLDTLTGLAASPQSVSLPPATKFTLVEVEAILRASSNQLPSQAVAALARTGRPQVAIDVARSIDDDRSRALALVAIAAVRPEVADEALDVARSIDDDRSRAEALVAIAPHLASVDPDAALDVAHSIDKDRSRAEALVAIARHLASVDPDAALDVARSIDKVLPRVEALVAIAAVRPEVADEALDVARSVDDHWCRALALAAIAAVRPEVADEALDVARSVDDHWLRALALAALAGRLATVDPDAALDVAHSVDDDRSRVEALVAIAGHLATVDPDAALDVARSIDDARSRAEVLAAIAGHLATVDPDAALDVAHSIDDDRSRAEVLAAIAGHLATVDPDAALDVARSIDDARSRVEALVAIAAVRREVADEALDVARSIDDARSRVQALVAIAAVRPEVAEEALDVAHRIDHDPSRAAALAAIAGHLATVDPDAALDVARSIDDDRSRVEALVAIAAADESLVPLAQALHRSAAFARSRPPHNQNNGSSG